jgi:hypothetical protein
VAENDGSFEVLNALLVSLPDLNVNIDRIAGAEIGDGLAGGRRFLLDYFH